MRAGLLLLSTLIPVLSARQSTERPSGRVRCDSVPNSQSADSLLRVVRARLAPGAGPTPAVAAWGDGRGPRRPFRIAIYSVPGGAARLVERFPDGSSSDAGIDGGPWERSASGHARAALATATSVIRGHEFLALATAPDSRWHALIRSRDTVVDGIPHARLEGRDSDDRAAQWLVRQSDTLPDIVILANPSKIGPTIIPIRFEDWQPEAGRLYPRRVKLFYGSDTFFYRFDSVRVGSRVLRDASAPLSVRAQLRRLFPQAARCPRAARVTTSRGS